MRKIMAVFLALALISVGLLSGCFDNKPSNTAKVDSDGDGYDDAVDAFPHNSTEWADSDGDGVGDNTDAFPFDANETRDSDGDGVGDNADAFPFDANETMDSDGDGIGDNRDAFPFDPMEWKDSDKDGVGDNEDYYPYDMTKWERPPPDAFQQKAAPYIEKLVLSNSSLAAYATARCGYAAKEVKVNALYRDVLMNYTCIAAALGSRPLQTPQETIQAKQGTCEDLSILLCSLLWNVGIQSSLVFTDAHVYAFASDVDTHALWGDAEQTLLSMVEEQFGEPLHQTYIDTYTLPQMNMLYIGGEAEKTFDGLIDSMSISYHVTSDEPLHLFVVPTQNEFFALQNGDIANFSQLPEWEVADLTDAEATIPNMTTFGGVVLLNEATTDATVNIDFVFTMHASFYSAYNENALTGYQVDGSTGVILDPRLGQYGFPGYDAQVLGAKTVIDPMTEEYQTLS